MPDQPESLPMPAARAAARAPAAALCAVDLPALPRGARAPASRRLAGLLGVLALGAALAGCAPRLPTAYSPPLQQGNVIDQDALAKLKPGMTRSQVRFVLGTPLVVDVFRNDRWDYVYRLRRQGEPVQQRRVTVIFEGDALARIEGDVVAGDGTVPPVKPVAPAAGRAPSDRGFFGRMFERIGL